MIGHIVTSVTCSDKLSARGLENDECSIAGANTCPDKSDRLQFLDNSFAVHVLGHRLFL